jgi:hypothetical protein
MAKSESAIEAAEKAGFDLSLVDMSLRYSHDKRAEQHDGALALVLELERIRDHRNAQLESPAPATR